MIFVSTFSDNHLTYHAMCDKMQVRINDEAERLCSAESEDIVTVKEIIKLASNDRLMFMLNTLKESMDNDCCRTVLELENEEKSRKIMAKSIKKDLEAMD